MEVNADDVALVSKIVYPNEKIIGSVMQRRIGPGGALTTPTSVVATDLRLIIVNRATLGIRHDFEVIPYANISSVRLEHGIISSSVFIRVQGYDTDKGLLKRGDQEGEIDGLRNNDAEDLTNLINLKIEERAELQEKEMEHFGVDQTPGQSQAPPQQPAVRPGPINPTAGFVFCTKCGTKNPAGSAFCSKCGARLVAPTH